MLKIAVFDTAMNADQIEDILVNVLFDKCEFGLETYTDARKALEIDFNDDFDFDILFLNVDDTMFPGYGIAKRLRKAGNIKSEIILMSSDDGLALSGYKLKAFDYLVKPVPIGSFSDTLTRYFLYYEGNVEESFTYQNAGTLCKIKCDDILYFMSNNRKCTIVNKRDDCEFYAKLDDVENALNKEHFVRVHQSYIVNMRYIKSLTKDGLTLNNNLFIPISQRKYADVKNRFMKYLEIEE